jgi:hypothetical protein
VQGSLYISQQKMDHIEVNFADVYRPGGCCRPFSFCINGWIKWLAPKVLNVTGVSQEKEAQLSFTEEANGTLYTENMLKASYGLHFLQPGETTKWDAMLRIKKTWRKYPQCMCFDVC